MYAGDDAAIGDCVARSFRVGSGAGHTHGKNKDGEDETGQC